MDNRKLRMAAGLLVLSLALSACVGCRARETGDLEILELKADSEGGQETIQDQSDKNTISGSAEENEDREAFGTAGGEDTGREEVKKIFVYVCGAVQAPGVYGLKEGARLYEAIACAGGVREDAAEESVNQAQAVADGERLYIPTDEEVRQGLEEFLNAGVPVGNEGIGSQEKGSMSDGSGTGSSGDGSTGKVNINTASREELKTLNGIGDTRAESILSYRESNGPFQTIEDLMKVDGIKEGIFNKMKDSITVN